MKLDKKKLGALVKRDTKALGLPKKTEADANDGFIKPEPVAEPMPVEAAEEVEAAAEGLAEGQEAEVGMAELAEEAAAEAEAGEDIELEDLLVDYMEGDMDVPPTWAGDPAMWEEAANEVGLGTPEADARYDEPYAVVAYLYKKMGGPIDPNAAGAEPAAEPALASEEALPPGEG